ncbi:MAG: TetR/AcrR family transcriptional regulator [Planctomycetota bacterium]|jgi:AcrR family transcriptional regulator
MAKPTRERLIKTAHRMFYRDGFHAVGLDRIIDEVGVTKTTFYNHFESKDELMLEVLNWHDRWWRETFVAKLRELGGDRPRDQLLAIFDALDELLGSEEFNGCIFVNVAVVFPLPQDPAHRAAAAHKQAMEDIIRELAGYACADDPVAVAREISLVMEGAYVTRQVCGDRAVCDPGRRIVELIVEKHLPAAATS